MFDDFYALGTIFMAVGIHGYVGLTRVGGGLNIGAAVDADYLKDLASPALAVSGILAEAKLPGIPALMEASWGWHRFVDATDAARGLGLRLPDRRCDRLRRALHRAREWHSPWRVPSRFRR